MNKKLSYILIGFFCIGLVSCDYNYTEIPRRVKDKLSIKVLKYDGEDTDAPTDFSILCIDNVKYLMTKQGGITVKFQANQDGDPSAEECE